jgi:hypothetical protein
MTAHHTLAERVKIVRVQRPLLIPQQASFASTLYRRWQNVRNCLAFCAPSVNRRTPRISVAVLDQWSYIGLAKAPEDVGTC